MCVRSVCVSWHHVSTSKRLLSHCPVFTPGVTPENKLIYFASKFGTLMSHHIIEFIFQYGCEIKIFKKSYNQPQRSTKQLQRDRMITDTKVQQRDTKRQIANTKWHRRHAATIKRHNEALNYCKQTQRDIELLQRDIKLLQRDTKRHKDQ